MSDLYLEKAFDDFASPNGICRMLCATSGVSTGLNMLDIDIVIQYGLCTDLLEGIQRAGQADQDGITASLFLLLVEPWVTTLDLDDCDSDESEADSSAKDFDAPPKSVKHLSGKKSQTGDNAIRFAQLKTCLRDYIATFLDDDASDALVFSNRWCCDRHGDDFDLQTFFYARIFHDDDIDNPPPPPPLKRKHARLHKAWDRKSLLKQLKRWHS
ncbi:hypothetical protein EWM64_g10343 [Hericium alpestre]|uniref:Helicase C-terminal domain-containing protein n=1 Tax=Hericium alpestre TaxID=135208 RepID=A0A4Y9ZJQ1_9AGAM|nr:hypothetical protein EWM64_g10343 [Hericium alpestre]